MQTETTAVNIKTSLYNDAMLYAKKRNTSVDRMIEDIIISALQSSSIQKERVEYTQEQQRRLALVDQLAGVFSDCQTEDWKKDKEEYMAEKYGK